MSEQKDLIIDQKEMTNEQACGLMLDILVSWATKLFPKDLEIFLKNRKIKHHWEKPKIK